MRRSLIGTLVIAVLGIGMFAIDAASAQPTTRPATRPMADAVTTQPALVMVNVTGEVLDMKCYAAGKHGEAHAACAAKCLKGGSDIGLLTKDGVVYVVKKEGSDPKAIETLIDSAAKDATIQAEAAGEKDGKTLVVVKQAHGA